MSKSVTAVVALSNGKTIPAVGLGTWQSKPGEVKIAVKAALDAGCRLIDGAYMYGNEPEIGSAIKEAIQAGKLTREDVFVVSKLWNSRHAVEDVRPSFLESLSFLGLNYIDLYLIHWPVAFKTGKDNVPKDATGNIIYSNLSFLDTWKEMEKLVDDGLVKSIGLSNFNSQQVQDVIDHSRIKPTVLQVELHPYLQQKKLVSFCQERGVTVMAYSPFGSPAKPSASANDPSILDDPKLREIATKYNKTVAQVIIRWLVQRNIVAIPKSVTPDRVISNFQVFDFELSADDMIAIASIDRNLRLVALYDGNREVDDKDAPHYPFNIEF